MSTQIHSEMCEWLGTLPGMIRGDSHVAVLEAGQRASGMSSYAHADWAAELWRCGYAPQHRGTAPNTYWVLPLPGAGINREST